PTATGGPSASPTTTRRAAPPRSRRTPTATAWSTRARTTRAASSCAASCSTKRARRAEPAPLPRRPCQALVFRLALWATLVLLVPIAGAAERGDTGFAALESALHVAVNEVRRQAGLIPLRRDPAVDRVARAHSEDMVARGYFAH